MKNQIMLAGMMLFTTSAFAAGKAGETFYWINAECSTVKECACQEVCYDVCRIVNNEQVCDQSCKTICEYSTSNFR